MDRQRSVLIVDDEPLARRVLGRMLERKGYTVHEVGSGEEALGLLESTPVDVVMSDIQMPRMDGFALLAAVKERYPHIRRVLVTAYNIDDYLSYLRDHDVADILPKGAGLRSEEMDAYLDALITGRLFGLDPYFRDTPIHVERIRSYHDARRVCASIVENRRVRDPLYLEMVVDELISNAVFHGVLHGVPRSEWNEGFVVGEGESVDVAWACDDEKIGVSVADPKGKLKKADILRWFERPLSDTGETEEHGRGLLLVRRLIDRFIINIRPGTITECIVLQFHTPVSDSSQKPLLVHEV
ncbi:MAG: response regulator [Chitinivibrionales bacterium]|nr:response regulator [Chitinivibrionales bacterium]